MKRLLVLALAVFYSVSAFGQSSKARTFNGTSDNLQSAATIDLSAAATISISFWLWFNSDAATQIWFETGSSAAVAGEFDIFQNNVGTTFFQLDTIGGTFCKEHFTDASAGAWHHYLFVWTITNCTGAVVYVDGVSKTLTNDNNNNGTIFGNSTLNVMARNAGSLFTAGRVSDIAIWTSALTSGNAASLASCANPQTVNGTPAFYWPINQTSPEVATDGGVNLTVTGTTNSASNCMGGGGNVAHRMTLTGVGH